MGLLGAVMLHAALISLLALGTTAGSRPRRAGGSSSALQVANGGEEVVSAIIYLDPRTLWSGQGVVLPTNSLAPLRPSDLLTPRLVRLASASGGLSDGQDEAAIHQSSSTNTVDGAERALLFGRYVNQIASRIDRAWVRPRITPSGTPLWGPASPGSSSSAGDKRFQCRVEIIQSRSGEVLEVTLLACDSSPEWQVSLVKAINAASPLPAPPNRAVFARMLVMNFTSSGSSSDSAPPASATPE